MMGNEQSTTMGQLMMPGRTPQAKSMKDNDMLSSIFSALPQGTMLKALQAVGVSVGDPQENLAPDGEHNMIPSWNDRRVDIKGNDTRPPVWDRNRVVEVKTSMPRGVEPEYLKPDYDSHLSELNVAENAPGGF